jgi:hypothetical protein
MCANAIKLFREFGYFGISPSNLQGVFNLNGFGLAIIFLSFFSNLAATILVGYKAW